jgi:hypothetical protein
MVFPSEFHLPLSKDNGIFVACAEVSLTPPLPSADVLARPFFSLLPFIFERLQVLASSRPFKQVFNSALDRNDGWWLG